MSPDFFAENEDEGMEAWLEGTPWNKALPLVIDMELHKLVKVEDWYNDKSTIMRTYRKGKGRSPYTDSVIYFRLRIEVNGAEIYSNYSKEDSRPVEQQEDFKQMTLEQRVEMLQDPTLIKHKLDTYTMPSLLQKAFKGMKKNSVITLTTTRINDKLRTNFVSDFLN